MHLERIEHVQLAMPSGEEDAARHFYSGALGMTEVRKPLNLVNRGDCWYEAGRVRVHLGMEADFRPDKTLTRRLWLTSSKAFARV